MPTPPVFGAEIKQMMYVAGETRDPSLETISLIESIVKDQVIHMIFSAGELAARRGDRAFSNNDLIFQFRHDTARVERLQKFLSLKNIRKSSRDEEDYEKDQVDETAGDGLAQSSASGAATRVPWDVNSIYSVQPPKVPGELDANTSDEQAEASNLEKLRAADRKTLAMTVNEYATWSEYRHASFTRRRVPRFREWCGLGVIADHKATDDVLDILSFLTSEMVQRLSLLARRVQDQEMDHHEATLPVVGNTAQRSRACESLFRSYHLKETKAELDARHIRRAYEMTQARRIARGRFHRRGLYLI